MEIIGTKRLPACHGMQSVLYIHMYWTQTCHRLWQPHSSHTKPVLSAAQCAPSVPPPAPILSDSAEMNIRTPWVCIQMICFSASHWSQSSEANKPGNYSIAEMGWAQWVGATEGGESVKSWEISKNSFLRPKSFLRQSWWGSARSICVQVQQRSPLIWSFRLVYVLEVCRHVSQRVVSVEMFMFSFICIHVPQKTIVWETTNE